MKLRVYQRPIAPKETRDAWLTLLAKSDPPPDDWPTKLIEAASQLSKKLGQSILTACPMKLSRMNGRTTTANSHDLPMTIGYWSICN